MLHALVRNSYKKIWVGGVEGAKPIIPCTQFGIPGGRCAWVG